MANPVPDLYTDEQWENLCESDPSFRVFEVVKDEISRETSAASPWQGSVAQTHYSDDAMAEAVPDDADAKGGHPYWRDIQARCWEKYRSFPPINASINSKADYVAGKGFGVSSSNLEIRTELRDLFYSHRNRLYARVSGWMIRMQAEGELFLLLSFDEEEGRATIRALEPSRIGEGEDTGLILNPEDATQTLFYKYRSASGEELIPDVNVMFNPDLAKLVKGSLDQEKLSKSRAGKKFSKIGGFRRFIIHWKNLTGILEYRRDTASLYTVLESVNLYWNAIKWQLDQKKALSAYTNVFTFSDTPAGKIAWHIWKSLSEEAKKATGLIDPLKPGARIFLMPGITYDVKAPQLQKLSGENQDLLNLAGAGARTPQDLWQGQASGSSYASLRTSRSPLALEIENMQHKLGNFVKYELLRACFYARMMLGGFPELFKKQEVEEFNRGNAKIVEIDVEPVELVTVTFPHIHFNEQVDQRVSGFLGSKHAGLSGLGVSDEKIASEFGIDDLDGQRAKQAIEREKYGETKEAVQ